MFTARYWAPRYWADRYWTTDGAVLGDFFLVFCDSTLVPTFITEASAAPEFFFDTSETATSFSAD